MTIEELEAKWIEDDRKEELRKNGLGQDGNCKECGGLGFVPTGFGERECYTCRTNKIHKT